MPAVVEYREDFFNGYESESLHVCRECFERAKREGIRVRVISELET